MVMHKLTPSRFSRTTGRASNVWQHPSFARDRPDDMKNIRLGRTVLPKGKGAVNVHRNMYLNTIQASASNKGSTQPLAAADQPGVGAMEMESTSVGLGVTGLKWGTSNGGDDFQKYIRDHLPDTVVGV